MVKAELHKTDFHIWSNFGKGNPYLIMQYLHFWCTVFLCLYDKVFSLPKQLKNLDPSCKTDLDLWDCLGRVNLIAKFHRNDLVIFSLCREGKTLSYSRINTVFTEKPYRKNSENWDTRNNYHNCPTIGTVGFYSAVLCSKDADRITNREDPDQTAP